jgi:hypothetical protein
MCAKAFPVINKAIVDDIHIAKANVWRVAVLAKAKAKR